MMQTQIPSGLQALMQASQILSSQASPTAPGPQGPQPTVAGRINDQLKQSAQPQPPQGGIAGLTPNMQEMGKQAGVAGQIMAQKQAQQQQQAQNPEAVAQMAAQMLQSKGVAGLPANMGFKEGGIIGFDGEERSDVPEVPGMDKLMEIMANAEGTQVAAADNQVALQALAEAQKRLAAAAQSGDTRSAQVYAQEVADLQKQVEAPKPASTRGTFTPKEISAPTPQPSAVRPVTRGSVGATPQVNVQRSVSPRQEPAVSGAYPDETRRGRATTPGIGILAAEPAAAPAERPKQAPIGIATALPAKPAAPTVGIPQTRVDTSGIAAPTIQSLTGDINALAPDRSEQFNKEEAAREEERKKLKAGMEDLNAKEIKALEEDRAARKQLVASKAERDQFNRVQSFFRDLYTRGDSYSNVQAGIFARDEAERLAEKEHNKAVILLQRAQQAEKLGDHDRASALKKEAYGRTLDSDKNRRDAAQIAEKLAVSKYGQEMETARAQGQITSGEARTAAEIQQRASEAKERHDIERAKLAQAIKEGGDNKKIARANDALGRWTQAEKMLQETRKKNQIYLGLNEEDLKKPENRKLKEAAEMEIAEAKKGVDAQWRLYDSISSQLFGGAGTAAPAGGASTNDPLGLRKK